MNKIMIKHRTTTITYCTNDQNYVEVVEGKCKKFKDGPYIFSRPVRIYADAIHSAIFNPAGY